MLISSQRYLDEEIVESKRQANDYSVTVLAVELGETEYLVVIDGHHSMAAAIADGVSADVSVASGELERQLRGELESVGAEKWLENHYNDSPYYDVSTGQEVW